MHILGDYANTVFFIFTIPYQALNGTMEMHVLKKVYFKTIIGILLVHQHHLSGTAGLISKG